MGFVLNGRYDVVDEMELSIDTDLETGVTTDEETQELLNSLVTGKCPEKIDKTLLMKNIKERYQFETDKMLLIEIIQRDLGITLDQKDLAA